MTTQTPSNVRPLSPHLQVYKPQISSAMSIFHRLTGVALAVSIPLFFIWLTSLIEGPKVYNDIFLGYCHTLLGQIILWGVAWSYIYHFCCGIRHLLWDAGYFLSIKGLYLTGYAALGVSTFTTLVLGLKVYGLIP